MIRQVAFDDPQLSTILKMSDDYMLALYPADTCMLENAEALRASKATVLGYFDLDMLVATLAIKPLLEKTSELKRIFVLPEFRRQGIAEKIIRAAEKLCERKGVERLCLETGIYQPEAIALYAKLGYMECESYLTCVNDELSVFMQKNI